MGAEDSNPVCHLSRGDKQYGGSLDALDRREQRLLYEKRIALLPQSKLRHFRELPCRRARRSSIGLCSRNRRCKGSAPFTL
jgi:hypothetical protein